MPKQEAEIARIRADVPNGHGVMQAACLARKIQQQALTTVTMARRWMVNLLRICNRRIKIQVCKGTFYSDSTSIHCCRMIHSTLKRMVGDQNGYYMQPRSSGAVARDLGWPLIK